MSDTATTRRRAAEPAATTTPETPAAPPKKKRTPDPEIQARAQRDRIMAELSPAAASRCIAWLDEKYDTRWQNRPAEAKADPDFPHAGP